MIAGRGPIDITSLVTRIATHVGALENAQVTYLPLMEAYQLQVGLEHFMQGHLMCEGLGNSLFMCYPGYDREIELPWSRLSLYSVKRLTLQMEKKEPARRSVASLLTQHSAGSGRTIAAAAPGRDFPASWTVYDTHELRGHLRPLYSWWLDRRWR
ncbi:hypothetical protein C2845_PM10G12290 [Panicum miliaceum]|uniref:Uncharacterized protein n=1 Tax=Panicum miliaceum TaxID=4540 RepID=A0A3L6PEQ5_PANMI|nr:hypothetical protein C2845_PM10G12290 [Panicum miliaceum]